MSALALASETALQCAIPNLINSSSSRIGAIAAAAAELVHNSSRIGAIAAAAAELVHNSSSSSSRIGAMHFLVQPSAADLLQQTMSVQQCLMAIVAPKPRQDWATIISRLCLDYV